MRIKSPRIRAALRACGAVLVRETNHHVFRLPNGTMMTIAKSASDHRAEQNVLADLKRRLEGR
jgi:hypothetical protein